MRVRCAAPTCRACAATCAPPPPAAQGEGEASSGSAVGARARVPVRVRARARVTPPPPPAACLARPLLSRPPRTCLHLADLACARVGARGISHAVDERELRGSPSPTPTHAESVRAAPLCTGRSPPGRPVTKGGMQAGGRAEPGRSCAWEQPGSPRASLCVPTPPPHAAAPAASAPVARLAPPRVRASAPKWYARFHPHLTKQGKYR